MTNSISQSRFGPLCGVLMASLLWLVSASPVQAQKTDERILRYHSEIEVMADATVEVTEHITVRSEQRNIRRGIYRDFPTRYRDRLGNRVVVDFEVIEVLRDGKPEPWFTENLSNGVRVNTGDDSRLPGAGEYTFSIKYRTSRQLGFFDEHDELYWNVTGLGWDFVIDKASAEVRLPAPVPSEDIRLHHFTGRAGSTDSHAQARVPEPGLVRFETTRPLGPAEGLTISVGFPKGLVAEPGLAKRLGWLLYDNRGLLILLLGGIAILAFYVHSWRTKGRGPEAGVIVAGYEPPEDYSPAGLRYVMRERYDHRCFAADLVEMGVKGLLVIEREKTFLSEKWSLKQVATEIDPENPPSQTALFPKLFEKDATLELKSSNASRVQAAMSAHSKALDARYKGQYIEPNLPTILIGWAASVAVGVLAFIVAGEPSLALILATVVLAAVNILFTNLMPAPTEAGRRLLDQIEGLKLYLGVAEKDDLSRLKLPEQDEPSMTPERFESLLPYALALDVEDAWTSKFTSAVGDAVAKQTQRNMGWYTGSGAAVGGLGAMSQSLGKSLSSSISSSASPPGSSSGGGGSSGDGGGGGGGGGR